MRSDALSLATERLRDGLGIGALPAQRHDTNHAAAAYSEFVCTALFHVTQCAAMLTKFKVGQTVEHSNNGQYWGKCVVIAADDMHYVVFDSHYDLATEGSLRVPKDARCFEERLLELERRAGVVLEEP